MVVWMVVETICDPDGSPLRLFLAIEIPPLPPTMLATRWSTSMIEYSWYSLSPARRPQLSPSNNGASFAETLVVEEDTCFGRVQRYLTATGGPEGCNGNWSIADDSSRRGVVYDT